MSLFQAPVRGAPRGAAKLLALNWALLVLLCGVASAGFLMLYSVAGGSLDPWARAQMIRFSVGICVMIAIGLIDIRFWRAVAPLAYAVSLILLIAVDLMGVIGMGAQRWIDLGPIQIQPSEMMKVALVMALAAYYAWLDPEKVSRPFWVILPLLLILMPVALVMEQPDLGTAILLLAGGARSCSLRVSASGTSVRQSPRVSGWLRWCCKAAEPRGSLSRIISSAGSLPFSTQTRTRSAPAITSPRQRSRWVRAGSRAAVTCRGRKRG